MTRYACNFVPMYKSYIETKHENRDRLGQSEMGLAGYLLTHPRIIPVMTKTCLYNFDPLKPHFCIEKLGLQGYTLFFLILFKNIDRGYPLEPPHRGGSNEYPQSMF